MIDNTEFVEIPGYEGKYQVNRNGEIKVKDTYVVSHKGETSYNRLQRGRVLKGGKTTRGYCFVSLNGKHVFRHQIVASVFIPNPNNYTEINHKDENPGNNIVDNLEWCSHKYNCNYGRRKTANQDKTKRVGKYDLEGNIVEVYDSLSRAEKLNNSPRGSGIGRCCRGKQKQYMGFKWAFIEYN